MWTISSSFLAKYAEYMIEVVLYKFSNKASLTLLKAQKNQQILVYSNLKAKVAFLSYGILVPGLVI